MSRIWAVARHMIAEGVRMKVALVFIGIILILLPALPFTVDGDGLTLKSRMQSFLAYSLGAVGMLLSLLTVFLSCAAISNEVRSRQIFMVASKPIPRWQFFLGKWLGICTLNAALLLLAGMTIWGFTWYLSRQPTSVPGDKEAVQSEVLTARYGAKLEEPNWEALVQARLRALREEGKADNLTGSSLAQAREQILREEQSRWRTLRPGEAKEFRFTGLLVDPEAGGMVHLHFKPTSSAGLDDLIMTARWQAGDREELSTLTEVMQADFVAGRFDSIPLPASAVNSKGVMIIRFANMNDDDAFTFEGAESFELLYDIGPFHWNLMRALLIVWSRLAFVAVVGLVLSSFLSFPVACMGCILVLLVASSSGFLTEAVDAAGPRPDGTDPLWLFGPLLRPVAGVFLWLVPDFSKFDPVGTVVSGRVVPLKWVMMSISALLLVKGAVLGLIGSVVFTKRELAQVTV